MNRNTLSALLFATATLTAQIDRESDARVDCVRLRQATLADLQNYSAQGYRMSNFEFNQPPPNFNMNVTMVRNTGVYAASWVFYFDKTRSEMWDLVTNNNLRIVDLERYTENGEERLAALAFVNSGQQHKAWHWFTTVQQGSVYSTVDGVGDRIIDMEPYMDNGVQRYHVISIANAGADQKPWWVYTDTTPSAVQGYMDQHDARLYDFGIENLLPGRNCCVLVRDNLRSLTLWGDLYWPSFDADVVNGGRVTMVHGQAITGKVITMLDNMNPFSASGTASVGTMGITSLTGTGNAFTGTQVLYRCDNFRPWAPTFIAYGFVTQTVPLVGLGAPGCTAYLVPAVTELRFANQNGLASDTLNIPLNPIFAGTELLTQFFGQDPGINQLGLQTSRLLTTSVRHW